MIFERSFDNLTSEDVALLNEYFCGYNYQSSAHTFLASYIWRNTHHLSWQIIGEYLCLAGRGDMEDEQVYFMSFPLTRTMAMPPVPGAVARAAMVSLFSMFIPPKVQFHPIIAKKPLENKGHIYMDKRTAKP